MKRSLLFVILFFSVLVSSANIDVGQRNNIPTCKPLAQSDVNLSIGEYFSNLFTTEYWPARWTCGNWNTTEGILYIVSDVIIFLAYMAIPLMLLGFMIKMKFQKYKLFIVLFSSFILACGLGHLLDAVLFWEPMYRLSGFLRIITAIVSLSTVLALVKAIPIALSLKEKNVYENEVRSRKEAEFVLANFVQYSPFASALIDDNKQIIACSNKWKELRFNDGQKVNLLNLPLINKAFNMALEGRIRYYESVYVEGLNKFFRVEVRPWVTSLNVNKGAILFLEDISEKKELQENLIAKNIKLSKLNNELEGTCDLAKIGSWYYDVQSNNLIWSKKIYEIHELEYGTEIYVDEAIDFYHEDFKEIIYEKFSEALHHAKPYDIDLQIVTKKNRNAIWVKAMGSPVVKNGHVVAVKGFFQDIDERKKNELKIDDLNRNLEIKVEKRTIEYKELNQKLKITLENLNKSYEYLLETEKMASLGQLIAGIAHELNTPMGVIKASVHSLNQIKDEYLVSSLTELRELDNSEYQTLVKLLCSLRYEDLYSTKEVRGFKRVIREKLSHIQIQNKSQVESLLVSLNAFNIDDYEYLFKIKRHLKILNIVNTLYTFFNNSERIKMAVDKSAKIVFALKSFTNNQEEETFQEFSLINNINTVLTLYHSQFKQKVKLEKNFLADPIIIGNESQMEQVWTNLIHNAIQAMDYSGKLIININSYDEKVIIEIKDTGSGIPLEIKDKIFKPFFTTKPKGEGTGLGLDIVYKIINSHNGSVTFTSNGQGTVFTVALPEIKFKNKALNNANKARFEQ